MRSPTFLITTFVATLGAGMYLGVAVLPDLALGITAGYLVAMTAWFASVFGFAVARTPAVVDRPASTRLRRGDAPARR